MKILITGGAGFIGSAVVRHLLDHTDHRVVNVDALTYAASLASLDKHAQHPRYAFEHVNICDARAMNSVFSRHQPDAVMHLAAESHVDRSIDAPAAFIQSNIVGTYTLLEAARAYWMTRDTRQQQQFRFHHVSTDEVFGDLEDTGPGLSAETLSVETRKRGVDGKGTAQACASGQAQGAFTETSPYRPSSPYSASKAASDHLVRAWGRTYGLPVMVSHCSNNYGPWQFPEKLIPLVIRLAHDEQPIPVYGDGLQKRDWLYVDDHVRALVRILERGVPGQTYNVSAAQERRNIDVVHAVCDLLDQALGDRQRRRLVTFVTDRPGHDRRYALDAGRLICDLDWHPQETFESGLIRTVQWYLDQNGLTH